MFQVENLFFFVALADLLKKTLRVMGFRSFYVILDSQLCFGNPVADGDGSGWKRRVLAGTATPTKPVTSKCA